MFIDLFSLNLHYAFDIVLVLLLFNSCNLLNFTKKRKKQTEGEQKDCLEENYVPKDLDQNDPKANSDPKTLLPPSWY